MKKVLNLFCLMYLFQNNFALERRLEPSRCAKKTGGYDTLWGSDSLSMPRRKDAVKPSRLSLTVSRDLLSTLRKGRVPSSERREEDFPIDLNCCSQWREVEKKRQELEKREKQIDSREQNLRRRAEEEKQRQLAEKEAARQLVLLAQREQELKKREIEIRNKEYVGGMVSDEEKSRIRAFYDRRYQEGGKDSCGSLEIRYGELNYCKKKRSLARQEWNSIQQILLKKYEEETKNIVDRTGQDTASWEAFDSWFLQFLKEAQSKEERVIIRRAVQKLRDDGTSGLQKLQAMFGYSYMYACDKIRSGDLTLDEVKSLANESRVREQVKAFIQRDFEEHSRNMAMLNLLDKCKEDAEKEAARLLEEAADEWRRQFFG